MRVLSRREFLLSCGVSLAAVGCGTIMHPERRGQPAGRLDWSIVALDALGLLLFFIPGVIAFAVDFNNGTIYLPPEYGPPAAAAPPPGRRLSSIRIPGLRRTQQSLEEAIAVHTGRQIELAPGKYRSEELQSIDQFWDTYDALESHRAPV
ncbi:MAG TPA: hypothetical protein VHB77_21675 [Planctomycetaceae bacterium]|nr:hypothetical protein [Planctomycetaceae bacterium]